MQEKVNKWMANGCNFSEGVALLASTGKHKQLVKSISGRPQRYSQKLRYELLKYAASSTGASLAEIINLAAPTPQPLNSSTPQQLNLSTPQQLNPSTTQPTTKDQLPPEVEHVIKLHADAYKTRAILHDAMAGLPSGNTKELVLKRKTHSDQIADCSLVIDVMHKAKEDYYTNGTIPDIKRLTELYTKNNDVPVLPDNIEELKEMKKKVQSLISKDQFFLDYQQPNKGKNLNPMPKGPKRTKIELRMKSRLEALENIELKLHELS
ncbi:MAG: hypothetical protein ACOYN4_14790 [Bacteroidales bacterium]